MRPHPLLVLLALGVFLALLWQRPPGRPPDAAPPEGADGPLQGEVSRVHDGDTLTLEGAFGSTRVRLAQIDAPELGQPWGEEAHEALRRLAGGRDAHLEVSDVDDYGRRVGDLFVAGRHVNEALVREGHAWAYRRWIRDEEILEAEASARRERRGLWSLPEGERDPPWDWRRRHPRR